MIRISFDVHLAININAMFSTMLKTYLRNQFTTIIYKIPMKISSTMSEIVPDGINIPRGLSVNYLATLACNKISSQCSQTFSSYLKTTNC